MGWKNGVTSEAFEGHKKVKSRSAPGPKSASCQPVLSRMFCQAEMALSQGVCVWHGDVIDVSVF